MPTPTRFDAQPAVALPPDGSRRRLLQGALGLLSGAGLMGLGGCGGAEDSEVAAVRLVNATVDFATAKLLVGGDTAVASQAYGGTVSDYVDIDSGSQTLNVNSTSGTSGPSSAYSFSTDTYNTVVAYGTLADGMKLTRLEESSSKPSSGSVKIRLLQAHSGLDGVDLYITNTSSLSDLDPTATADAYEDLGDFATIDSGYYRIRLTKTDDRSAVLFDSGSDSSTYIGFTSKQVVTLAIVPRSSGSLPDISALPEKQTGGVLDNALA